MKLVFFCIFIVAYVKVLPYFFPHKNEEFSSGANNEFDEIAICRSQTSKIMKLHEVQSLIYPRKEIKTLEINCVLSLNFTHT